MNIAIISNGHGEDTIALNLIKALPTATQSTIITFPLVGSGHIYHQHNLPVKLKNPTFPSGGFIRTIKDLFTDIRHGLLTHILQQVKTIKQQTTNTTTVIAVGDIFCLILASFSKKPIYFLPTAKSDTFMPHSFIERWLIKKIAQKSYPRDNQTTQNFLIHKLPAAYFGNPMMDNLSTYTPIISLQKNQQLIGLLPGSRKEAYKNFQYILTICEALPPKENLIFACAWVPTLNIQTILAATGWSITATTTTTQTIQNPNKTCSVILSNQFNAIINQATLCIGLAGTANEQAIYLKKPVVCFAGFGPQSTVQRFKEQQKLLGPLLTLCERNITTITATILKLLASPKPAVTKHHKAAAKKIMDDIFKTA